MAARPIGRTGGQPRRGGAEAAGLCARRFRRPRLPQRFRLWLRRGLIRWGTSAPGARSRSVHDSPQRQGKASGWLTDRHTRAPACQGGFPGRPRRLRPARPRAVGRATCRRRGNGQGPWTLRARRLEAGEAERREAEAGPAPRTAGLAVLPGTLRPRRGRTSRPRFGSGCNRAGFRAVCCQKERRSARTARPR